MSDDWIAWLFGMGALGVVMLWALFHFDVLPRRWTFGKRGDKR